MDCRRLDALERLDVVSINHLAVFEGDVWQLFQFQFIRAVISAYVVTIIILSFRQSTGLSCDEESHPQPVWPRSPRAGG